jgi:Fe2+ transport system protein FeoA
MTLNEVNPEQHCVVKTVKAEGAIKQRFMDMGLVPEVEITVVRNAPLKDPMELKLGSFYMTIRKSEAALIEVESA